VCVRACVRACVKVSRGGKNERELFYFGDSSGRRGENGHGKINGD